MYDEENYPDSLRSLAKDYKPKKMLETHNVAFKVSKEGRTRTDGHSIMTREIC